MFTAPGRRREGVATELFLKHILPKPYNSDVEYPLYEELIAHQRRFNQILEEVALEEGAWFVDNEAALGGDARYFRDHLHYTVEGVRRLAQSYADALAPKLAGEIALTGSESE